MRNFQRQRGWGNILQSKPVLALLGIFILFFAWNIFNFWNKMEETSRNKNIAEQKLLTLQEQKIKLGADINSLQTDEGKEKVFRENFGLAKEGEGLIVVVDDKNTPPPAQKTSSGFWGFFTKWFK